MQNEKGVQRGAAASAVQVCHLLVCVCVSVQHLEHLRESAPLDWFQAMADMPVQITLLHES